MRSTIRECAHAARRRVGTIAIAALVACNPSDRTAPVTNPPPPPPADTFSLRALAGRRGLRIGAAIDQDFRYPGADGVQFRATMTREFSMLTPGNDMKHQRVHPLRDVYRFGPADSMVAFAVANGMQLRGHTLVWHQQLASWLTAGTWTPDQTKTLLADHITNVVSHFRGQLVAWDVVNEALADNGTLRSGFWYDHIGRDYIEQAFRAARAADPDVLLFYNDYNIEGINAKSDSAYALVRDLLARDVPIHGIGLQAHFQLGGVPSTMGANIARFAALGLKVHLTELDVRMRLPTTSTMLQAQAQDYRAAVASCLPYPACNSIVVWGVSDRDSWVPAAFPGWGEALMFDALYQRKPAYAAVYDVLK